MSKNRTMLVHVSSYLSCAAVSASERQARAIRSAAGRLSKIGACRSSRECLAACLPRITRAHRPARSRSRMPPTTASNYTRFGTRNSSSARRLPHRPPRRPKALRARACRTSCAARPQRRAMSGPHFIRGAPLLALTSRVSCPMPAVCAAPHLKFALYYLVSSVQITHAHFEALLLNFLFAHLFVQYTRSVYDDYGENCCSAVSKISKLNKVNK